MVLYYIHCTWQKPSLFPTYFAVGGGVSCGRGSRFYTQSLCCLLLLNFFCDFYAGKRMESSFKKKDSKHKYYTVLHMWL